MYKMNDTTVFQEDELRIAKITLVVRDNRNDSLEGLTIFTTQIDENDEVRPRVQYILDKLGYEFVSITSAIWKGIKFNTEKLWDEGLLK